MILHQTRRSTFGILFVTLIGLGLLDVTPAAAPPGPFRENLSEITGSLKSLIYSFNQFDNKLERHEHRERALGELLKKAMQQLQKGQKNMEPITGIFSRLDERVSQIETLLLNQEEKYNFQRTKIDESLEKIYRFMIENNECMKRPPGAVDLLQVMPKPGANEEFMKKQDLVNKQLLERMGDLTSVIHNLIDSNIQSTRSPNEVTEILTKIEDKLVSYNVPIIDDQMFKNKEFEDKVTTKMDEIITGIEEIKALPKPSEGLKQADKDYIQNLSNETMNALELVKNEVLLASDKALAKTTTRIKESEANAENNFEKVLESVTDSSEVLDRFYSDMNSSYAKLNVALEVFDKFNQVVMANSEHVLETQRKVEYGSYLIVQKIGDLIEKQRDDVFALLKARFDNIDETMLNNKLEAMKNLSEIIDAEIGQVWRRIEIMGDEITTSTDLLKMFNGRNEVYVNSTLSTMDTMGTSFERINDRMHDLTSNLNYLLGKLSLMSQEFGHIKIGLAESLDELREAFHGMQDKVPKGPGPHNIANTEYETHINNLRTGE